MSGETRLKQALGAAYSASVGGTARQEVLDRLRKVLVADEVKPTVAGYLANLEAVVTARSAGGRCGCHLSREQLALLKDALR